MKNLTVVSHKNVEKKGIPLSQVIANDLQEERDKKIEELLKTTIGSTVTFIDVGKWTVTIQLSNNVCVSFKQVSFCKDFGKQIAPVEGVRSA